MAVYSGQTIVALAGTVVRFTTTVLAGRYRIKPLLANTGAVFISGGTTTVTTLTGFELTTGRDFLDITVDNLGTLYLDAATNGDGVCWHRLYGAVVGISPPA